MTRCQSALTLRCRRPQWPGLWSKWPAASTTLVVSLGASSIRAGLGALRERLARAEARRDAVVAVRRLGAVIDDISRGHSGTCSGTR